MGNNANASLLEIPFPETDGDNSSHRPDKTTGADIMDVLKDEKTCPNYMEDEDMTTAKDYNYILPEQLKPILAARFIEGRPGDKIDEIMPTEEDWKFFAKGGWKSIFRVGTLPFSRNFHEIVEKVEGLEDMKNIDYDYYLQTLPGGWELRLSINRSPGNSGRGYETSSIDYQIVLPPKN